MSDEIFVVNASPIIVLAKIDRLDLLVGDRRMVMIPEAVTTEIQRAASTDAVR